MRPLRKHSHIHIYTKSREDRAPRPDIARKQQRQHARTHGRKKKSSPELTLLYSLTSFAGSSRARACGRCCCRCCRSLDLSSKPPTEKIHTRGPVYIIHIAHTSTCFFLLSPCKKALCVPLRAVKILEVRCKRPGLLIKPAKY